jgi:hypothetical protein
MIEVERDGDRIRHLGELRGNREFRKSSGGREDRGSRSRRALADGVRLRALDSGRTASPGRAG